MSYTSPCAHMQLEGPYEGNHLGETELGPHPRCTPMQNRRHYHGECWECGIGTVVDARYYESEEAE